MTRKYAKKYKAKPKKNGKRPYRRRKVQVTPGLKNVMNKMILKKLDQQIEDKYKLDTVVNEHSTNFDAVSKSMVFNVSPHIENGTEVDQRLGNKVRLKYLRTFFQYLPAKGGQHGVVDSSSPAYTENWVAQRPDITVYFLKINSEMIQNMTEGELRTACNAKFRSIGHCWQDFSQSSGKQAVSAIKLLEKFKMPSNYRQIVCPFLPLNSTGTIGSNDFTLTPVYQASATVIQCPQYSYHNMLCSKVAQKIEIDDSSNNPIKYQYWYFVQLGNGYNNNDYNPISQPESLTTRNVWVYEDA